MYIGNLEAISVTDELKSIIPSHTRPTFDEETALLALGHRVVAGVDEAGRGPLAGPVVAGAVVVPPDFRPSWLAEVRDSKLMTPAQREAVFGQMEESGIALAYGVASPEDVDSLGIVGATKEAMLRAIRGLPEAPGYLLIDALPLHESGLPLKAIVKGDRKCVSIAAASIVAKVTRDRLMADEDAKYPGYGFAQHKGYPTRAHLERLSSLGPCPIHRRSFAPVQAVLGGGHA